MIECVQGPCVENQKSMFNNKVVEFCKDLITEIILIKDYKSLSYVSDDSDTKMQSLVKKTIKLLTSLLEGNIDSKIYRIIADNIDFNFLLDELHSEFVNFAQEFYELNKIKYSENDQYPFRHFSHYFNTYSKEDSMTEEISEAFDVFFFLKNIGDHSEIYASQIKNIEEDREI